MATTYTLEIEIDDLGLVRLREIEARIVIAKPVGADSSPVAWLALRPAARISVRWTEAYGVYASATPIHPGAVIEVLASVARTTARATYPYTGEAFGPALGAETPDGYYDIRNDTAAEATVGLLQAAAVDGRRIRSPINAVALPAGLTADFAPAPKLEIWARPAVMPAAVIAAVPTDAAPMRFGPARRANRCVYDLASGAFFCATP